MHGQLLIVFGIALAAALASPLGGALAVRLRPSTMLLAKSMRWCRVTGATFPC